MAVRDIPFDRGMADTDEFVLITCKEKDKNKRWYKGVDVAGEQYPSDSRRCMRELRRNMLEKDDPSEWFDGPACESALRVAIAVCLKKHSYADLIQKYRHNEPGNPVPGSDSVRELSRAFLGTGDAPRFGIMRTEAELDARNAELDSKEAVRRKEILAKVLEIGCALRTPEDIKNLSPDEKDMLLQVMDEGPWSEKSHDDSDRDLFIPTPYVGYFAYRFLVSPEERDNEKGHHPIAYWSTKQAWNHTTIERLWNENDRDLKNWEFESFLEVSVNDFLYKANERASATSGLSELIRKRLSAARRERYEFIRVLAGEKDDPFIEQIRQVVDSGGKWDASRERRHGYRRKMTRWGNYGKPAEMSALVNGTGSRVWSTIRADSRLRAECERLTIHVGEKKPGGRMPNVGRKGSRELEEYLKFCFDVADGTLPMRSIVELVLRKCPTLRPLGSDNVESRHSVTMGRYSKSDVEALEMERSFKNPEESEW